MPVFFPAERKTVVNDILFVLFVFCKFNRIFTSFQSRQASLSISMISVVDRCY